jgi:DNA polymerase-3 subunit gamma/tau
MAYKALYRTYRPKDFDEVAGQEHITKTFKNALSKNKLSHAYLFSGPRGTGKTSIAKIIAKAVNCENAPVKNPCNECAICKGIDNNTINDVIEIDAASNNGVDEIREIRDKVKYLPGVGKYKVYIIDEVHMLSTGAFNALLKTLEEPPRHAIFILATTEPHKVPSTIHSRCQRFDFRGIQKKEMLKRLNLIIEQESIDIEEDAKVLITESAAGGMRDAISLLDQVMAFSEGAITKEDVHTIRGSVSEENILNIVKAVQKEDAVKTLHILNRLIEEGKESNRIIDDLIVFYRDLLYVKNTRDTESKTLYQTSQFQTLSETLSNAILFHHMDILNETKQSMRFSTDGKLYLELGFIKMVDDTLKEDAHVREKTEYLEETLQTLQNKLETLENRVLSGEGSEKHISSESSPADKVFDAMENKKDALETKNPNDSSAKKSEAGTQETPSEEPLSSSQKSETESPTSKANGALQDSPSQKDKYTTLYNKFSKKKYKTFDIHFVEDVLNSADREMKIAMGQKWYDIERFVDASELEYAKMITEGRLVATNGVMIVVAYDTPVVCNRLMQPSLKGKILSILERYFNRKMMFLALPKDVWQNITKEFIKKFRSRESENDFIPLSPIENARLVEIPQDEENYEDVTDSGIKEARKYFGDIVKEKKGE